MAGSPVIGHRLGAFLTLLRQSGLQTFTGGVLATKSECKMLASTCLYSLYAWLMFYRSELQLINTEHSMKASIMQFTNRFLDLTLGSWGTGHIQHSSVRVGTNV